MVRSCISWTRWSTSSSIWERNKPSHFFSSGALPMNRLCISLVAMAAVAFLTWAWFGSPATAERVAAPAPEAKADPNAPPKRDYAQLMQKLINYEGTDDPKTKL